MVKLNMKSLRIVIVKQRYTRRLRILMQNDLNLTEKLTEIIQKDSVINTNNMELCDKLKPLSVQYCERNYN